MTNYEYLRKYNPEKLYIELSNKYSPSARKYFAVLKLAFYHIDGKNLESSFEITQYGKSKEVWALACDVMRTLYHKGEYIEEYIEEHNGTNQADVEAYNSGWQDGFVYALDMVLEAINRNYNEADREGDDEYINERIAGWENVKNTINEMKESYLGEEK